MRTEPYILGENVKLRPYGRGARVFIVKPSGVEMRIPCDPASAVNLELDEIGGWTVQWEAGEVEPLQVIAAPSLELVEEEVVVVPLPSTTGPITTL